MSTKNTLIHTVIFFVGLIYVVWPYSVRWDSINNPTDNVTVQFRDSTLYKGTLWTDFHGKQNLRMDDGRVLVFDSNGKNMSYLSFESPKIDDHNSSMFRHWRALLPLCIWCFIFVMPTMYDLSRSLTGRRDLVNLEQD